MMRHYQKGEIVIIMLVMMVVMMAVVWNGSGHMGMGHDGDRADHAPEASSAAQQSGSKDKPNGEQPGNKSGPQDEHMHDK